MGWRRAPKTLPGAGIASYWSIDIRDLTQRLRSGPDGLSTSEATRRLAEHGRNQLRDAHPISWGRVLIRQIRSPLLLLLVFAATVSAVTAEWFDAGLVIVIVLATVAVGSSRESSAQAAAAALRSRLRAATTVVRDRRSASIATEELVPGDVVLLSAGNLVPADAVVLEASDFFVSETEEEKDNIYRCERSYGSFFRVVPLPDGAKLDDVKATFTDGVLEVSVPLPAKVEARPRTVNIEEPAKAAKSAA